MKRNNIIDLERYPKYGILKDVKDILEENERLSNLLNELYAKLDNRDAYIKKLEDHIKE